MSAAPAPPHAWLLDLIAAAADAHSGPVAERLARVAHAARAQGLVVLELGLQPAAEARDLVDVLAAIALQGVRMGRAAVPTLILSAGPVRLRGAPAGAAQFLLALALALDEHPAIHACAMDSTPLAGEPACVRLAPGTLLQSRAAGLDPGKALLAGSAGAFFVQLGEATAHPRLELAPLEERVVLRALLLN